jgi:hypothetical protein
MLAVLGAVFFAIGWFEHGAHASGVPVWFDSEGMKLIGLVLVALHLVWPGYPWRRP